MVERPDLKNNFLKRIILRCDYSGVVDIKPTLLESEDLLMGLPDFNFVEMDVDFINEEEYELNDPVMSEIQTIPLREIKKTENFKYKTKDNNIVLQINRFFVKLTVNPESYTQFEEYSKNFIEIVTCLKKKNRFLSQKD